MSVPKVTHGSVYKRDDSIWWWMTYAVNGKRTRRTTQVLARESRSKALDFLNAVTRAIAEGNYEKQDVGLLSMDDLTERLRADYVAKGNRSLDRALRSMTLAKVGLSRVLRKPPSEVMVGDIGYDALAGYVARRLKDDPPAAPATVRNELAALKRALNLLRLSNQGFVPPKFPTIRVDNARQEFFEPDELEAVLQQLRGDLRAFVRCVAITGWRNSAVRDLTWDRIDWTAKQVRLDVGKTKNRAGRIFPFAGDPEMETLLRNQRWSKQQVEQAYGRVVPWVFHRPDGSQIRNLYTAWKSACVRAGCPGKFIHDLRRTARRRYVRAGVSEVVAMKLLGHKTRAVFDRYHIVSDADIAEAVTKDAALRCKTGPEEGSPAIWSRGGHADPETPKSESA